MLHHTKSACKYNNLQAITYHFAGLLYFQQAIDSRDTQEDNDNGHPNSITKPRYSWNMQ